MVMLADFSREEKSYNWLEAAKSYEHDLQSSSFSPSSAGDYWQRIGYCYELASRQTNDLEGFKNLRGLAVEAYEKANRLFFEGSVSEKQGKGSQCLAFAEYARSWLASSSHEKQKALDKCHDFAKVALAVFENSGNKLEFGKTANVLNQCLFDRLYIATTGEEIKAFSKE